MAARATIRPASEQTGEESAPITKLLDHIAAELAAEYVRLMEAAAERDRDSVSSTTPHSRTSTEGGCR